MQGAEAVLARATQNKPLLPLSGARDERTAAIHYVLIAAG
jgi:hypothetical protein